MIELAPANKLGLSLTSPILPAAGFFGYATEYARLIEISSLGAIVTNPITLGPRSPAPEPRMVELPGGVVLSQGAPNPGVKRVIRAYAVAWRRLGLPVIAHLAADRPGNLERTAGALESTGAVAGLELGLPEAPAEDLIPLVRAVRRCELPLLIKLPFQAAVDVAMLCEELGADALVVATPPPATARHPSGAIVSGALFGPAVHSLVVPLLAAVRSAVGLPLIACGGIHDEAGARLMLECGAAAVQVDSLFFVDPMAVVRMAQAFA